MKLKDLFEMQKKYQEQCLYGFHESQTLRELETQKFALCAHAELSSLVNATDYKTHHRNAYRQIAERKDIVLHESVDVVRYMIAIMNTWDITSEDFANAYDKKDTYLRMISEINDKKWNQEPVVIVDLDDVIVDFRQCFADWLEKDHLLKIDVDSEEYYFITALSKSGLNPEAVFEQFTNQGGFSWPDIKPGAHQYLCDLKNKGYWIQYLTARPNTNLRCMYDTYDWIANHKLPYDGIDFATEKFRWCAKSKFYEHIEYAIDDSPKHAEEYAMHGIKCFVPEMPYNKHCAKINNIERCKLF